MWTEKLSNVVLDHGCKQYAVCEPYVRTHAHTHRQNSQLNKLVWGSLTLAQLPPCLPCKQPMPGGGGERGLWPQIEAETKHPGKMAVR